MSRTITLVLALSFGSTIFAQSYLEGPEGLGTYFGAPNVLSGIKPVQADVFYDTTVQTPWGPHSLRNTGKFWRSSNGSTREDDAYGRSLIYDRKKQQWIEVDHQLQTALVRPMPAEDVYEGGALRFASSSSGFGQNNLQMMTGKLEGRKTQGTRQRDIPGVADYVRWWDVSTRVLVEESITGSGGQLVTRLRLRNLREEEPDPSLFRVPKGYVATYCNTSAVHPAGPKNDPYPLCVPPSAPPSRLSPP